jgi:hypothetical protein
MAAMAVPVGEPRRRAGRPQPQRRPADGYARQTGGTGGRGYGAGHIGGAGGVASKTTATATGYSARANAVQSGGGGYGAGGAKGGAGAASTLSNAVKGTTAGGLNSYLRLYQTATGGAGSAGTAAAGAGGAATSSRHLR